MTEPFTRRRRVAFRDQLVVVAAYVAIYHLLEPFSVSQWVIPSAIRVGALLLVPRRYWFALVVADTLALLDKNLVNAHRFGLPWALTSSFPFILICMTVFRVVTRHMPLHDSKGDMRMTTALVLALACSVVTPIFTAAAAFVAYLSYPDPLYAWSTDAMTGYPLFVFAYYLGTLTIVPLALVLREYIRHRRRKIQWLPLILDAVFLVVPYLSIIVAGASTEMPAGSVFAQLAITLPVISMTAAHGKRGASVGGPLSIIAMVVTFTNDTDPRTLGAEGFLALVITAALVSTEPSRPVRTFSAHPEIRVRFDRASFYFERGVATVWTRLRRSTESP
ncbi:MASE1 domain-containing protein [Luteibacter aegosomatis]|uniref:MASE1 domain-containing protein n=1 Tax=Luteibacter aegosomatis TaxID=2911537 RepID=UPI001FFB956D|nr:MASE1 domain-containing protein [Luteibacter aegosomatis]UPG87708.1 MASE1 domain-containing protein [Luteibacter aegosomatis]